jgi:hypothetical protein
MSVEDEAGADDDVVLDESSPDADPDDWDYGPPFVPKTFGAAFAWARGEHYVCTVLRVREGENVIVSTQNRRDMNVMLTGGRAVLEVDVGDDIDRVELLPAAPVYIDPNRSYRLLALTEVEIFTVYELLPKSD